MSEEPSEAPLTERLRHPIYVPPYKANGGYILDPKTVRADMTAAADELERLQRELAEARANHALTIAASMAKPLLKSHET